MTEGPATGRFRDAVRPLPGWLLGAGVTAACVLLVGGAVWMLAEFLQKVTVVVVPVLLALLVAAVFEPVVRWGRGRTPDGVVPLVIVLVLIGVVVGGLLLIGERLAEEVPKLADDVESGLDDVLGHVGLQTPDFLQRGSSGGTGSGGSGGSGLQSGGSAASVLKIAAEIVVGFFLTMALAFLFMKDGASMWRWIVRRTGSEVDRGGRAAWGTLGLYVRGLTIVALFDALATAAGLLVLGVPLVATLAVLQFVGSYVPTFGALAAGAVAVLVAFVAGGLSTAGLTLVLVVVVQQIGNDVIEPWVMGRTLRLHPTVVLVAVTAGAALWDVAGALLFVPLVAAGSAAVRELASRPA